jgi:hypothetical protein
MARQKIIEFVLVENRQFSPESRRCNHEKKNMYFLPVLRIRIHVFLGLQDPDPQVRGMDPDPDPALDPDPSIIMQK